MKSKSSKPKSNNPKSELKEKQPINKIPTRYKDYSSNLTDLYLDQYH